MEVRRIRTRELVYFHVFTENELTWKEVNDVQARHGYMPEGYGPPCGLRVLRTMEDDFVLTWHCSASCD